MNKIPNHAHSIIHTAGVRQLKPRSVHLKLMEDIPTTAVPQGHPSFKKYGLITTQLGQHPKTHNDVNDISLHPTTTTQPTS